jgi:hypothetical protein
MTRGKLAEAFVFEGLWSIFAEQKGLKHTFGARAGASGYFGDE